MAEVFITGEKPVPDELSRRDFISEYGRLLHIASETTDEAELMTVSNEISQLRGRNPESDIFLTQLQDPEIN